jgi:hypothetical protein
MTVMPYFSVARTKSIGFESSSNTVLAPKRSGIETSSP